MLMSKEIYFDRIESYVEGTNSAEEKREFENDLEENPDLQEEYQAYLATKKAIDEFVKEEILAKLDEIAQRKPVPEVKVLGLTRRTWAMAAGVLILIGALMFLYGHQEYSDDRLFAKQYERPSWDSNRGDQPTNSTYDKAISSLQNNEVEEAADQLSKVGRDDEAYNVALYVMAHLQLQADAGEEAVETFNALKQQNDKRYQENVDWFLALAYLKVGEESMVDQQINTILQNEQHPYYQDALTLRSRLQSFWRRF